jgi:hypothetical protein
MNDSITVGLITASATILNSAITGSLSYKIAIKAEKLNIIKKKLYAAYRSISSFYQLEIFYTEKLAQLENKIAEAVKRLFREKLRNDGFDSPSRYSIPSYINDELRKYEN